MIESDPMPGLAPWWRTCRHHFYTTGKCGVRMSGKIITARVLIRTARQNTQRFWHLIDDTGIRPSQHEVC